MKIRLDMMDGECTPTVRFCCNEAFLSHRDFYFNVRAAGVDECRLLMGEVERPIEYCPFCGAKILFLRNGE